MRTRDPLFVRSLTPLRTTRRTVFRETSNSRRVSLIAFVRTKYARPDFGDHPHPSPAPDRRSGGVGTHTQRASPRSFLKWTRSPEPVERPSNPPHPWSFSGPWSLHPRRLQQRRRQLELRLPVQQPLRSARRMRLAVQWYGHRLQARASIGRYLSFYNDKRPHSSLGGKTPDQAYTTVPTPIPAAA